MLKRHVHFVVLSVVLFMASSAYAQSANDNAASINQDVRAFAQSRWQLTDVEILTADEDLNASRNTQSASGPQRMQADSSIVRVVSLIILLVLLGTAFYLLMKNRMGGGLFAKQAEDQKLDVDGMEVGGLEATASNEFSLNDLRKAGDTRRALRLLLVNVLARAAKANDVPIRRSLTARDIVARLPNTWKGRERVAGLVAAAEPVLFGGRTLDQAQLDDLVEQARPVLSLRRQGL